MNRALSFFTFIFAMFFSMLVSAATVGGVIPYELATDITFDSGDNDGYSHTYGTLKPDVTINLNDNLSVRSAFAYEPDSMPMGENVFFSGHGVSLTALELGITAANLTVRAGEYTPILGIAGTHAPGIYGADYANAVYELDRRLSMGLRLPIGNTGLYVSGDTFESMGEEAPPAAVIARLGSAGLMNLADVGFEIGVMHGARGEETGIGASLYHTMSTGEISTLRWMLEGVHMMNAMGMEDEDKSLLTAGAEYEYDQWSVSGSSSFGTGDDNLMLATSAQYAFANGFHLGAGWKFADHMEDWRHTVGARIGYAASF